MSLEIHVDLTSIFSPEFLQKFKQKWTSDEERFCTMLMRSGPVDAVGRFICSMMPAPSDTSLDADALFAHALQQLEPIVQPALLDRLRCLDAQEVGNIEYWISKYVENIISIALEDSAEVEIEE